MFLSQQSKSNLSEEEPDLIMQPLPSPDLKMELPMSAMIHFILSYLILFIGVYLLYIVVFLE